MISFRLSEQEYRDLMDVCETHGANSLSDLARHAMHRLLVTPPGHHNGHGNGSGAAAGRGEMEQLFGRMLRLEDEVKRLGGLIEQGQRGTAV